MKTAQFTKSLTVSLRQDTYDRIKAITDEEGISMADWVRAASERFLIGNRNEGCFKNSTKPIFNSNQETAISTIAGELLVDSLSEINSQAVNPE